MLSPRLVLWNSAVRQYSEDFKLDKISQSTFHFSVDLADRGRIHPLSRKYRWSMGRFSKLAIGKSPVFGTRMITLSAVLLGMCVFINGDYVDRRLWRYLRPDDVRALLHGVFHFRRLGHVRFVRSRNNWTDGKSKKVRGLLYLSIRTETFDRHPDTPACSKPPKHNQSTRQPLGLTDIFSFFLSLYDLS